MLSAIAKLGIGRGLLPRTRAIVQRMLAAASPSALMALAGKLGFSGAKNLATKALGLATSNKAIAAYMIYDIFGPESDEWNELVASDPEIADFMRHFTFVEDKVEGANNAMNFTDEFKYISDAAGLVGGFDNFLSLRNAFKLSNETIMLYAQFRELKEVIR